jgi:ribonuclease D
MLKREGRTEIAQASYDYHPTRARLDLAGREDQDNYAHS